MLSLFADQEREAKLDSLGEPPRVSRRLLCLSQAASEAAT
jgi:hypothetical protein